MKKLHIVSIVFLLLASAVFAQDVNLTIVPGSPVNGTYVFECTPDFNTAAFNWDFGDTVNISESTGLVQHTYIQNGNYTVMCTAINDTQNASAALNIEVNLGSNDTINENDTTINETNDTNTTSNQTNQSTQMVSIMIMKHLCANITTRDEFAALEAGKDPVAALANTVLNCPTTGLLGNEATPGAVASARTSYDFIVTGDNNASSNLTSATYAQHQICESDINVDVNGDGNISNSTCLDISHYEFMNVSNGTVTVMESQSPPGFRFGTLRFTPSNLSPNNDAQSLVSLGDVGNGIIVLNTTSDTDGMIMLHVYNFAIPNGTNDTNQSNDSAHIGIKSYYPQSGAYVFECVTPGITPTSYSWYYGDDSKNMNVDNENVFHTYLANGDYNVTCSATDGTTTVGASRAISINDIPQVNTCSAMQDLPATCDGGVITQQDFGKGCRTIICDGNNSQMQVLACDKPSANNPLYFDMYKESGAGNLQICLGDTCIKSNGFARSQLLTCMDNQTNIVSDNETTNTTNTSVTNETNETNTTMNTTNQTVSVSLMVAPGFPQNLTYVFICQANGFNATNHSFIFGDGQQQLDMQTDNVYHTFEAPGEYNVICSASDGTVQTNSSLNITAGTISNETNGTATNTTNMTSVTKVTTLSGANEVPPTNSTATGSATATLDGSVLSVSGTFNGLSSNGTAAHVHIGPVNVSGSVLLPLTLNLNADNISGNFSGNMSLGSSDIDAFNTGDTYVNVHSDLFPDGEIRGQLS